MSNNPKITPAHWNVAPIRTWDQVVDQYRRLHPEESLSKTVAFETCAKAEAKIVEALARDIGFLTTDRARHDQRGTATIRAGDEAGIPAGDVESKNVQRCK